MNLPVLADRRTWAKDSIIYARHSKSHHLAHCRRRRRECGRRVAQRKLRSRAWKHVCRSDKAAFSIGRPLSGGRGRLFCFQAAAIHPLRSGRSAASWPAAAAASSSIEICARGIMGEALLFHPKPRPSGTIAFGLLDEKFWSRIERIWPQHASV